MPRDHQLLVGWNCPDGNAAPLRREARPPALVGAAVERHAQPLRITADALSDRRRVFADSGGEDDRIESTEGGCERSELPVDAVAVEIDREVRARFA